MKRFTFSMQKVLDLRNFQLDQAQADLGKIIAQINQRNLQLKELAEKKVLVTRRTDASSNVSDYFATDAYFKLLEQTKERLLQEIVTLEMQAQPKREVVRECMKKVKVLEELKKKRYAQWKKEVEKEEELSLEEVVAFQSFSKE